MSAAAAFQATFSDWKLIRGRKVVQVIFEVPLELADHAYGVLGGMPDPGKSVWCAVARLPQGGEARGHSRPHGGSTTASVTRQASGPSLKQESEVVPAAINKHIGHTDTSPAPVTGPEPGRARKRFDELSPTQQAGILSSDPSFWKFLVEERDEPEGCDENTAASWVRWRCGVDSRANIKPGTEAAEIWAEQVRDFRAWVHAPEYAPEPA